MFGSILDLLGNLLPAVGFPPVGWLIQRVHIDRFSLLHAKNGPRVSASEIVDFQASQKEGLGAHF